MQLVRNRQFQSVGIWARVIANVRATTLDLHMKNVLIFGAITAAVFLTLAVGTHVWWYHYVNPTYLGLPNDAISTVQNISDIEHLRKTALWLLQQHSQLGKNFQELLDKAINLIVALCLISGVTIGLLTLYALKSLRKSTGQELGWLRWL
jgi:hypothetical protein